MTTKSVPVYRNGRKFYISAEEYHRLRSEERIQRRAAVLKSQNLPVTHRRPLPTRSAYNPVQRSQSNPYEYQYGILRTPHIPMNSVLNTDQRYAVNRSSRSPIRKSDNVEDSSSSITTKIRSPNVRSSSSDKILDLQRSNPDNEIKRSFSTEMSQIKSKQPSPPPTRRPVPTTISDYGIAPISTFSMTPNDQSHTQTNRSKIKKYFAGIKPSRLNSPSKSSVSASSGTGSFFETGVQGADHVYTVLGSSNRRTGSMHSPSDTLAHNDYHHRDTASGVSFADENSPSLLSLIQRRNTELIRSKRDDFINGYEGEELNPIRDDLWTGSTNRSQSSDGLIEKKRVRFADMEGLKLESNRLKSPVNHRLLNRRQYGPNNSDSRGQARPFHNTLYQTTTKTNESKLATDV